MPSELGAVERLVASALNQRLFVLLCTAALVVTGWFAFREVPVEAFPDLTNNQVVVITEAPGISATEVEERVTYPIETALMGVPNAEEVRSLSKFGLSMISVVFEDSVPTYFARQLVSERLAEARSRIPEGYEPVLGPVATAFGEIYQYLIEGDLDPLAKKTLQDWEIRTRLRSVPGVSEINAWGGSTQQYHVIVRPESLEKHGLALAQVVTAIELGNLAFSGGFFEHRSERWSVRGDGLVGGVEDLAAIAIETRAAQGVTLGDVADVRVGPMPRNGAVTRDGRGETVAGMVIALKGENAHDLSQRVRTRIEEIEKTLPARTRLVPFYDQSQVIDGTARTVRTNLLEGSALVIVVLLVFLRDVRAALVVACVIPLAMLAGFIGMRYFGVSANLMSLGAIDFGLIVDGAVVMMENFVRRRNEAKNAAERPAMIRNAALEVARPILFGVLIIVAVYFPVFTLEGLEGRMFKPMAITVCSALLGALVLSLTFVPVAASYVLKVGHAEHEPRWYEALRAFYRRHLENAMNHRARTVAVAVTLIASALVALSLLGTEFMPRLDEGAILIETRKLPSVSLEESAEISTRVEAVLMEFPEVAQVVTKLGRPDVATEAMGIYQGDVYVNLTPREQWKSCETKEELIELLDDALARIPGLAFNFTQPMAMRLDEVVSGVKADVAVKIFGPDEHELERLGTAAARVLEAVPGAADVQAEVLSGASQVTISIDRAALGRYGLSVADVAATVEAALGGRTATSLIDGPRRFDVVVRLPSELASSPEGLARVTLRGASGELVPLDRVARLERVRGPEAIQHEDGARRIVVQSNVRGRDLGGFVTEARERLERELTLPAGYFVTWGGQFENQERAMARLALIVPLSLAIIFVLLFATFQRVRQAVLVIANVPFALVGGVAALWIRDLNLNLSASVGFIALFGVAVLNGVVMIAAINRIREESGLPIREAVLEGASTRLKPVLMTALVAALGFVPMALSSGAGAEIQRPLASVVIGGVVTSMLLTLIVLPTLYEMIERSAERRAALP